MVKVKVWAVKEGWVEVDARDVKDGPAITRPLGAPSRRWNITHLSSGKMFMSVLGKITRLSEARVVLKSLHSSGIDWTEPADKVIDARASVAVRLARKALMACRAAGKRAAILAACAELTQQELQELRGCLTDMANARCEGGES